MVIIEVGGEKGNKTFTAVVAMATKKVNVRWIEQGDKRREKNDKEIEYVEWTNKNVGQLYMYMSCMYVLVCM